MRAYETWLLKNAAALESADNAVMYLTMFLPGQSQNAELGSEAIAALFQMLKVYQDDLVTRVSRERGIPPALHARFLEAQYDASPTYHVLAYVVAAIRSSELLLEMTARHRSGEHGRKRAVLAIEATKAALRLTMLGLSKRALPNPAVHIAALDSGAIAQLAEPARPPCSVDLPTTDLASSSGSLGLNPVISDPGSPTTTTRTSSSLSDSWVMPRSGKELPPNPSTAGRLLSSKVLNPDKVRRSIDLLRRLTFTNTTAEVLSILRPLIYAVLLFRMRNGRRRWTPWLVGIAVELLSRQLTLKAYGNGTPSRSTGLEGQQIQAKTSSIYWWLLRGAVYENTTRPAINRVAKTLARWPVLSIGSVLIEDYLYLFDNYDLASASY